MPTTVIDDNSRPALIGVSNADNTTPVRLWADPTTHRLLVDSNASGGSAGTEYTEGDTDTSITGVVAMMEVGSDTVKPIQGTVADGLLVNLGSNNDVTIATLPLPSGAATSAKQDTGNTSLSAINSDTTAIAASASVLDDWDNAASDGASVSGDVAHDAVDAGEPVKIGGKALTSTPTPVAANDRVNAWFNEYGQLVISDYDVEVGSAIGSTGLRDRLMAQRYTVLADSLADGLAGFWTSSTANGGTATSSGGEGLIQTSANATGSAQITSTTVAYFPGQVGWFNSAVRFNDTGSAGNIRRIGVYTVSGTTPQDGFYYELSGSTLNAVVAKAGTPTAVASASWSRVSEAPFTLDTNYHSFEIRYTANTVWFYIDNVLRHKVSGTTASITATLNFPITIVSVNTSGATNRLIAVRNCGIGRFGSPEQPVNETGLSAVSTIAVGGGTPHDSVDSGNPLKIGGYAKATAPTTVADGDRVNAWFSQRGALNVENPTAANLNATVVGTGTFAVQATVAAGATNIAKAEDVASADADVGVPAMAIRKATPANTSGTDGDYEMLQMSAGRLWVDASGKTLTVDGSGVTQPVNNTQIGGNSISTGNGTSGTGVQRVTIASDSTGQVNTLAESTSFSYQSAQNATKTQIKGSAATLWKIIAENANTSVIYLQMFNKLSASVTVGTTTPDDVIPLPAGNSSTDPAVIEIPFPKVSYGTGLTIAATTTRTGSTNPGTAIPLTIYYI